MQMFELTMHAWWFIFWKLLFYSVISTYQTLLVLGLIKKTHTVIGRNVLTGLKKVMNVLGVSALLFGNNLQFNTDEILNVLDPVLDICHYLDHRHGVVDVVSSCSVWKIADWHFVVNSSVCLSSGVIGCIPSSYPWCCQMPFPKWRFEHGRWSGFGIDCAKHFCP